MNARVKAYAKLNLTLSVTGKAGGYHLLDSLVCSVDLYDLISLRPRGDGKISVAMHGMGTELMPEEENNAYRAAVLYKSAFGTGGADIEIYKNIPLGAGLGGSSADAAGVVRGMSKLYGAGSEKELKGLCDSLGSDTGYMLTGGYAVISGRGDKVSPLEYGGSLDFLLLMPPEGVSTAECYRLYDSYPQDLPPSSSAAEALRSGDKRALGSLLSNALFKPASALNGSITEAYSELAAFSPLGVNMTGSGSGVYALFENAAYCRWAQSRYRGKFRSMTLKTVNI